MKILVTSDLHGWLPNITESFDLLLICGDVCPAHDHYFNFQKEWIKTVFVEWINNLPFKDEYSKVIMTWGNHDFVGERFHDKEEKELAGLTQQRLVIAKNKAILHDYMGEVGPCSIKVFGTPYCKVFGNWAFMVDNDKLAEKYSECPDDIDIIISHDAPIKHNCGLIQSGFQSGVDAGNPELDKLIDRVKPKYYFCGHIHSGNHVFMDVDGTMMANASLVSERYYPTHPILCFEIDDNKNIVEGSINPIITDCEEN